MFLRGVLQCLLNEYFYQKNSFPLLIDFAKECCSFILRKIQKPRKPQTFSSPQYPKHFCSLTKKKKMSFNFSQKQVVWDYGWMHGCKVMIPRTDSLEMHKIGNKRSDRKQKLRIPSATIQWQLSFFQCFVALQHFVQFGIIITNTWYLQQGRITRYIYGLRYSLKGRSYCRDQLLINTGTGMDMNYICLYIARAREIVCIILCAIFQKSTCNGLDVIEIL